MTQETIGTLTLFICLPIITAILAWLYVDSIESSKPKQVDLTSLKWRKLGDKLTIDSFNKF